MIIVTAVGPDRPGMAYAVASRLAAASCNIEDTTMTRLSGEFAMILIVSPPSTLTLDDLARDLQTLETSHGLFINCKSIEENEAQQVSGGEATRFMLSVYGPERSGLVARITGALAEHGVNITDVQTRVAAGGAVYVMLYEIELPPALSPDELDSALEVVARDIGAQISLRPLEENTL